MRPNWQEYFMEITLQIARRSTCLRRQVGAIIIKDNSIISTGYNGAPILANHCENIGGCLRDKLNIPSGQRHEICRAAHAEQNAIAQAARHGIAIDGCVLYCTHQPCSICAKIIINAGIKSVFHLEGYPDELTKSFFEESGVSIKQINIHSQNL